MDDHPVVLQLGIQALAIRRNESSRACRLKDSRHDLSSTILPQPAERILCEQQQAHEEADVQQQDCVHPGLEAGLLLAEEPGGRHGHDRGEKTPEKERACLSSPERRNLVEGRQCALAVGGHKLDLKLIGQQRAPHEQGCDQHQAANDVDRIPSAGNQLEPVIPGTQYGHRDAVD